MFPPIAFTERDRELYCSRRWAVVPRSHWLKTQFWGDGKLLSTDFFKFMAYVYSQRTMTWIWDLKSLGSLFGKKPQLKTF